MAGHASKPSTASALRWSSQEEEMAFKRMLLGAVLRNDRSPVTDAEAMGALQSAKNSIDRLFGDIGTGTPKMVVENRNTFLDTPLGMLWVDVGGCAYKNANTMHVNGHEHIEHLLGIISHEYMHLYIPENSIPITIEEGICNIIGYAVPRIIKGQKVTKTGIKENLIRRCTKFETEFSDLEKQATDSLALTNSAKVENREPLREEDEFRQSIIAIAFGGLLHYHIILKRYIEPETAVLKVIVKELGDFASVIGTIIKNTNQYKEIEQATASGKEFLDRCEGGRAIASAIDKNSPEARKEAIRVGAAHIITGNKDAKFNDAVDCVKTNFWNVVSEIEKL